MGLISRVSSRTYRDKKLIKKLANMGNSHTHQINVSSRSNKAQIKLQLHKTLTSWLKVARAKMYILETHLQTSRPNSHTSETASSLILEIMNCTFSVHSMVTDFQRKLTEKNFL